MRILAIILALSAIVPTAAATIASAQEPAVQRSPALPPPGPPPLYLPDQTPRRILRDAEMKVVPAGLQQPPPTDEFEPISELPADERLPAAPMLVGAYVFVAAALFFYVFSLSRRLNAVAREMVRLESQIKRQ